MHVLYHDMARMVDHSITTVFTFTLLCQVCLSFYYVILVPSFSFDATVPPHLVDRA